MMRLMRVLPGLIVIGTLGAACDEQGTSDASFDVDFRRSSGECLDSGLFISRSPTKTVPTIPVDHFKPLELNEAHLERIKDNYVFALSAGFAANEENAAQCKAICAESGFAWTGNGCVVDLDITFGEGKPVEPTDETPAFEMLPVDASASMGCVCN
jgi:hypothetical protein